MFRIVKSRIYWFHRSNPGTISKFYVLQDKNTQNLLLTWEDYKSKDWICLVSWCNINLHLEFLKQEYNSETH